MLELLHLHKIGITGISCPNQYHDSLSIHSPLQDLDDL